MEPFKPQKNVIHITSNEKSRNYKWEKDSNKISTNLQIVSIDDIESMPLDMRREMFSVRDIEEGMVFVKDPVSDRYYLSSGVADEMSKNKANAISLVAMYLGAKKVIREIDSIKTKTREFKSGVGATYKVVDMDFKANKSSYDAIKSKYASTEEFDGIASENGYQKALDYCKRTGLIYDPSFQYFLEQRNPENDNKKRVEDIRTEITSECDEELDIAFSLNALKGVFTLDAKCENSLKVTNQLTVHSRIEF